MGITRQAWLASVTYQDASTRLYIYDDPDAPGSLTGIIDEAGNRYATWDYDSEGRAILSEHADGVGRTEITYPADHLTSASPTVTVTNALGHTVHTTYARKNSQLQPVSVEGEPCSGFVGGTETYQYDSDGHLDEYTNRAGRRWTYTTNDRGLQTRYQNRNGTNTYYTWHETFALPTSVRTARSITDYTYDGRGRGTGMALRERYEDLPARQWTYSYYPELAETPGADPGAAGQLHTIDGPRTDISDITTFTYTPEGYLATITNALGHVTAYQNHDAHGRPQTLIDANGVIHTLAYDLRGRLISETGPSGTISRTYHPTGQLESVTWPDGSSLTYDYDAAQRLMTITDGLGNQQTFTRDALGNITQQQLLDAADQLHALQTHSYNAIGWHLTSTDAYGHTQYYGYDVVGNRISEENAAGGLTSHQYNAWHQLTKTEDPLGNAIGYHYGDGAIARITDPRRRPTYFARNDFLELIEERSPDRGTGTLTYDSAGNVATRTDANGTVFSYTYDGLNRLTAMEASPVPASSLTSKSITYSYDSPGTAANPSYGVGRLTGVTDASGTWAYTYTPDGQIASESWTPTGQGAAGTLSTHYQYQAGQLAGITYPSGLHVELTRNATGEIAAVEATLPGSNTPVTLASGITRAPFGPVTGLTHGNGLTESSPLDQNYRPANLSVPGLLQRNYSYSATGTLSDIEDTLNLGSGLDTSQSFTYDAAGRLTGATGPYGTLQYLLDESGNREGLTVTPANSATPSSTTYTVNYSSNRLVAVGQATYLYDANGNLTDNGQQLFGYDAFDRMEAVADISTGTTVTYGHNHAAQRVQRTLNGQTRLILYDQAGHRIEERDAATGAVLKQYIWLDNRPLAYIEGNTLYHIHTDHLGTPQALTDSTGQLAWQANYRPYGDAAVTHNPDNLTFNLRLPGQYLDATTGLHHNWHREYDPQTGRYLQPDPLGLEGGINPYAYALNDPLSIADPTGEIPIPLIAYGAFVAFNAAMSAWDAYDTYQTFTDDCATLGDKITAGGLMTATIFLPGRYGWVDDAAATRVTKGANKAPDFVVSPNGTAFPVPKGATGPTPVVNPAGKKTGDAFTGGSGGANGQVDTMRMMDPTPPRGNSPGYPNGYIKYENKAGQGVDPYTGRTLSNKDSHFQID